jgi:hypothetical protein
MPSRCGCADTCACLVTPGAGVSVGGVGTVDDPYVIDVDAVPVTDSLGFGATPTVEFTTSGAGTVDSPTMVTANAKVGMRELTDVKATDVPVTGDVVTWNVDHWEFSPQKSVPPGGTLNQVLAKNSAQDGDTKWITVAPGGGATVNVGGGIGGDGSVTTPVSLRNSGTWPLAGFPADQSGLLGREVYVDSNGVVRAKPDVVFSATTGKPGTDLIGTYPVGVTVMTVTAAQGTGWPANGSCSVLTIRRVDGAIGAQWCCLDSATKSVAWYRSGNAGGWSPWVAESDPALPAPVYAQAPGDVAITSTATGVETPTHVRATLVNPHPYRRMLVEATVDSWVILNAAAGITAAYLEPFLISGGGVWATVQTTWRDEVQGAGYSFYRSAKMSCGLWVPAAATLVMGVSAHRSSGNAALTLRVPRSILVPQRYE